MTRRLHACLTALVVSMLYAASARFVLAQAPASVPKPAATATSTELPTGPGATPALTAQDVEAFLDGMIPLQLRQNDIAGTVVSIVKNGKVLFTKGYGYSDVKARKAVTTDATLFRIGSISKTFTWTAVMQLVEQGKIDLNRDINSYLDFTIPAAYGKPVTMNHVLTHTAGFEENIKDLFVASDLRSIGDYLKTHVPNRIYAPGTTPSYSNYGATLAGYVVERVSGTPFNEYVRANILQPLGMTRATFEQPLPADLKPFMSQGYAQASQEPKKFELVQAWPAGSAAASAEAMSRFMIAHLEDGQLGDARILKPETARLMHSRLFGVSPAVNGMAHGFYEESRNGQRIVGHGGDTQWFHSDMHLVLDEHLGFFISSNSAGKGGDLRAAVWTAFLDRYYPYDPPPVAALPDVLVDARAVAGAYMSSRRAESNVLSVVVGVAQERVSVNADSTISSSTLKDLAGNPKHFREIAPLVFREVNGQALLAFVKDGNGNLVLGGDYPFEVGTRSPLLKNDRLNIGLVCFALIVFVASLLAWPVTAMMRKHYRSAPTLSRRYRQLRLVVRATAFAGLLFIVLVGTFLTSALSDIASYTSAKTGYFHFLQVLGVVGVLGLPVAVMYTLGSWRERELWVWTKVWNTILPLAFVAYAMFMFNWRLLSM